MVAIQAVGGRQRAGGMKKSKFKETAKVEIP
jgi:hypothetical protein